MKNFLRIMGVALVAAGVQGCIKNDLPYPKIPQYITAIAAEGEKVPAVIDTENYKVQLELEETTDIMAVRFTEFEVTEGATADPDLLEGTYDLTQPLTVTVARYQDYPWVITATQEIERYFTIEGQIGETHIDAVGRRVIVKVPETADLSRLTLTSVKLGPAGITQMVPDLVPGPIDLSAPLDVDVTCFGRTEVWTVYAEKTELVVQTVSADAWSQVIWVYGAGPADVRNGVQYRRADSEEWLDVPSENVSQPAGQGGFTAHIDHLETLTDYVVRTVSGSDVGNEVELTTQAMEQLPNSDFESWWLDGKIWCPWAQDGVQFWDTGNTGAATLGESNVQPSDDVPPGTEGRSARLETRFVGLFGIGKLAAGSVYTGKFAKVDGTNGILDFGRPWTMRPTRLRGYMKYHSVPIDYASTEFNDLKGQPDECHIYVALTDWAEPYQIRTNPKNRQLFDPNSPEIIGYGELIRGEDTDGWVPFTIEIDYRSTSRVPRYIQVTCAASRLGDYFTGGAGTCLWVDELSLDYDY